MKDKYLYSGIVCIHIVLSVPGPHMSSHWHHGTQEEQHGAGGDHCDGAGEVPRTQEQPDYEHLVTLRNIGFIQLRKTIAERVK